jgi:hypothetical protein
MPASQEETFAVALGDVDGDGDLDLVFGNCCLPGSEQNRLYLNDGSGRYTDATAQLLPTLRDSTKSVALGDVDADGDLDLVVGNDQQPNRLYLNNGSGRYTDATPELWLTLNDSSRSVALGDVDADGDLDLVVGNYSQQSRLYLNNGRGGFTDVTTARMPDDNDPTAAVALGDVDADGDLDLLVGNRSGTSGVPNRLYLNDGSGTFTDATSARMPAVTHPALAVAFGDVDADGDLDLVVGNMDGDANALFRNEGGRFTDVAATVGLEWGGRVPREPTNGTVRPCAADVNNDGVVDLFFANYGRNGLFLGHPNGRFEDASAAWGIDIDARYDACAFSDFDHDGLLDLYVNGTVTGGVSYRDYLFRNTGSGFVDVTPPNIESLQADHGVQWADVDGDGDEDLSLTGVRDDGMHHVLRNQLAADRARRSIFVRVLDGRGRATRAGAEVRVYAAGTQRMLGMRLVDSGSGYNAQSDLPVHMGLPDAGPVDVVVTWPARGTRREVRSAAVRPAGQVMTIRAP